MRTSRPPAGRSAPARWVGSRGTEHLPEAARPSPGTRRAARPRRRRGSARPRFRSRSWTSLFLQRAEQVDDQAHDGKRGDAVRIERRIVLGKADASDLAALRKAGKQAGRLAKAEPARQGRAGAGHDGRIDAVAIEGDVIGFSWRKFPKHVLDPAAAYFPCSHDG